MQIPYKMTAAMSADERCAQMLHAVTIANARGYARLQRVPIDDTRTIALACYGPSLASTWETLRDQQRSGIKILSMSGATHFLAERGVIPDFHLDMDPRAHKAKHLDPLVPGVHYLMASVCPRETWDLLANHPPELVTLWHTYSGANSDGIDSHGWVHKYDRPDEFVVHGGSTIGLTALHVAGIMGYRHFEIHGMDGNRLADGQRHAGVHYGHPQNDPITWAAEGVTYHTSQIMANAVAETINTVRRFPLFCVFHGDGLTQALIREADVPNACTANQTEKAARVRTAFVRFVEMPTVSAKTATSYWDALIDQLPKDHVLELIRFMQQAEPLRKLAKYNTGSISLETMWLLRAACHYYKPKVIVEIGTFIGCSTYALQATDTLYTCDASNDCLQSSDNVIVHPFTSSTKLLHKLVTQLGFAGNVDLFFFDGRIQSDDIALIQHLSHPRTIFLFDDCVQKPQQDKGLFNIALLMPHFSDHGPIPPHGAYQGRSTLGALVPLVRP